MFVYQTAKAVRARVWNYITQSSSDESYLKGQLYTLKGRTNRNRHLVSTDAAIAVNISESSSPHVLIIWGSSNQDNKAKNEHDSIKSENEDKNMLSFLLDANLEFDYNVQGAKGPWLEWKDQSGRIFRFLFAISCSIEDIEELIKQVTNCQKERPPMKKQPQVPFNYFDNNSSDREFPKTSSDWPKQQNERSPLVEYDPKDTDTPYRACHTSTLSSDASTLYRFSLQKGRWVVASRAVLAEIYKTREYAHVLRVRKITNGVHLINARIGSDTNPTLERDRCLTFSTISSSPKREWKLEFNNRESCKMLKEEWDNAVEIFDNEPNSSDEESDSAGSSSSLSGSDSDTTEGSSDDENNETNGIFRERALRAPRMNRPLQGVAHSLLVVGQGDLSFLICDSQIKVHNNHGSQFSIPKQTVQVKTSKKNPFNPTDAILVENEKRLIFNIKGMKNTSWLYQVDIETGKLISSWNRPSIIAIEPDTKFAPQGYTDTFLTLFSNGVSQIDRRHPDRQETGVHFSTVTDLTTLASTGQGNIVTASQRGVVRMYRGPGSKRANTLIPGSGGPVTNVDVSVGGDFILTTFKDHLELIRSLHTDSKDYRTGFHRSFPSANKPRPITLELSEDDIDGMSEPLNFTCGQFNVSSVGDETAIIATSGRHLIVWDLSTVLRNREPARKPGSSKRKEYRIIEAQESPIVGCGFLLDRREILLATGGTAKLVRNPFARKGH